MLGAGDLRRIAAELDCDANMPRAVVRDNCRLLLSEVDRLRVEVADLKAEVAMLRTHLACLASAATIVVDHGRDGAAVQHDAAVRGLREAVAAVSAGMPDAGDLTRVPAPG